MRTRTLKPILILSFLALASCAGSGNDKGVDLRRSSTLTGATNEQGVPYTTGGDTRPYQDFVEEQNKTQPELQPQTPKKETPAPKKSTKAALKDRLREFQIARFDFEETKASRFGEYSFSLKVFFKDERTTEFKGPIDGRKPNLKIAQTVGNYSISGNLEDGEDKTESVFTLSDSSTQESVKIYYRAYKTTLTVTADRTQPIAPGSKFEAQLNFLKFNTFAWVHNWVVEGGASFYLNDIVKRSWVGESDVSVDFKPILTFGGESLQTGNEDLPSDHQAFVAPDSQNPDQEAPSISLIGNGEDSGERLFTVTLPDEDNSENKDGHTILVDVGPDTSKPVTPAPTPEPAPAPEPDPTPAAPQAPTGKEFLKMDLTGTRTAQMARDLDKNKDLKGVKAWMQSLKSGREARDARAFFKMANPVRAIVNAISSAYDMAPVYFYITYAESRFFKVESSAGAYVAEWAPGAKTHALGPYQFQPGTARSMGMRVTTLDAKTEEIKLTDERAFFVPSACGAAGYLGNLVNTFKSSDSTIAILGYHEGETGAKRLVNRAKELALKYGQSYVKLSETSVLSPGLQDYANKILAMYFLGKDPVGHGFDLGNKPMPKKNMFPPAQIKNTKCRNAVAAFQ